MLFEIVMQPTSHVTSPCIYLPNDNQKNPQETLTTPARTWLPKYLHQKTHSHSHSQCTRHHTVIQFSIHQPTHAAQNTQSNRFMRKRCGRMITARFIKVAYYCLRQQLPRPAINQIDSSIARYFRVGHFKAGLPRVSGRGGGDGGSGYMPPRHRKEDVNRTHNSCQNILWSCQTVRRYDNITP